jgi:hypothetical protein
LSGNRPAARLPSHASSLRGIRGGVSPQTTVTYDREGEVIDGTYIVAIAVVGGVRTPKASATAPTTCASTPRTPPRSPQLHIAGPTVPDGAIVHDELRSSVVWPSRTSCGTACG